MAMITNAARIMKVLPWHSCGCPQPTPARPRYSQTCTAAGEPKLSPHLHARAIRLERMDPPALLDRGPDAFGSCGHVDMADAERAPERVHDRVHHRRARSDRAGFAGALHAERVGPTTHVARLQPECPHRGPARDSGIPHARRPPRA